MGWTIKYDKVKSHPGPVTDSAAQLTLHSADGQLWATLVCSTPMSSQSFTPLFSSSMKNSARTSSPGDSRRGEGDPMTKSAAKRRTRLYFCRSGLLFRPVVLNWLSLGTHTFFLIMKPRPQIYSKKNRKMVQQHRMPSSSYNNHMDSFNCV